MLCPNNASRLSRILCTPKGNGSPDRHLTLGAQDRATPTINGRARCYRRKNGPQRESRRAGVVEKEPSRERLARPPRTERIPGEGGVSNVFGSVSLPGLFFRVPCLMFQLHRSPFLRAWNDIIPMMIFFRIPRDFGSAVERRAFDCVPTHQ